MIIKMGGLPSIIDEFFHDTYSWTAPTRLQVYDPDKYDLVVKKDHLEKELKELEESKKSIEDKITKLRTQLKE